MALDTVNETAIEHHSQLVDALANGCKPIEKWRIGTEHEKFGFFIDNLQPVPYEGKNGIQTLLNKMQEKTGWEPIIDDEKIIGLVSGDNQGAISLEPGGQFELSGAALETLHETCRESNQHLKMLKEICQPLNMGFLGIGGSPKWTFEQTPQMPKSRYDIMRTYMPKVGRHGLDMMHRTCTIQVNLDFSSEKDMRRKMIVATKLQSVVSALFAASPFTNGEPNGMLSWRSDIWKDTDNQRAGIHKFMMEENFSFEKYVDWALDIPMYFIKRDGKYKDCTHITFRQFMQGALKGEVDDPIANEGDWINHLSTLFPDVRLKSFLEMRGADGGPWNRICALPAFWVGLLYDPTALDATEQIAKEMKFEDVKLMRDEVPSKGLMAKAAKRNVGELAKELLSIARQGLKDRKKLDENGFTEEHFIDPLQEIVAKGETPAEEMLKLYKNKWKNNIDPIFSEYAY